MKKLNEMYTVEEVDDFIDNQICRDMPGLRAQVESRKKWTAAERANNPKLDAVCKALERRAEVQNGV